MTKYNLYSLFISIYASILLKILAHDLYTAAAKDEQDVDAQEVDTQDEFIVAGKQIAI